MSRLSEHHQVLTNGVGKCSVPMWCHGLPAGFCDQPAYGNYVPGESYRDARGNVFRLDSKYIGYVPALACPAHGGPLAPQVQSDEPVLQPQEKQP